MVPACGITYDMVINSRAVDTGRGCKAKNGTTAPSVVSRSSAIKSVIERGDTVALSNLDDYFPDWKEREALAEAMIPLIGKLYRSMSCSIATDAHSTTKVLPS